MIELSSTEITKPNDWLVANVMNPKSSMEDLKLMALFPENTSLKDLTYYKEQDVIKQIFKTPTGGFDEAAFDTYYKGLLSTYNEFSTDKFRIENFVDNMKWNEYNLFAPVDVKPVTQTVGISKIFNPENQRIGVGTLDTWSPGVLSMREVAQTQEVKDSFGKGLGFTPNDDNKRGFFDYTKDLFSSGTKALAQFTSDGTHIDLFTGETTTHKKGEYKYNEFGKPYYETIDGQTPINRQLLSPWDTLTVEGSFADDINFMSSDDKKKTFVGSVLQTAAIVAPHFIPGIGQWYSLATVGLLFTSFMPSVGKMVGGFLSGEDFKDKEVYKVLNQIEGFGLSMTGSSVSDYSMQNMFTLENLLNIVPMVAVQLAQQNTIGKNLPKLLGFSSADAKLMNHMSKSSDPELLNTLQKAWKILKTVPDDQAAVYKYKVLSDLGQPDLIKLYDLWVKTQNKVSKGLAVGYMTLASATDIDQVTEEFDIHGKDAAWMKLGVLLTFWASMNYFNFGSWLVEKAIGLEDVTKTLKKEIVTEAKSLQSEYLKLGVEGTKEIVEENTKNGFVKSLKGLSGSDFFNKGKEFGEMIMSKFGKDDIVANMMKESAEEITEEMYTDGAKILFNIFATLDMTNTKDVKINWDNDSILARYTLSGIGGAIGGGLFHMGTQVNKPSKTEQPETKLGKLAASMFANGQLNEVYAEIDKVFDSKLGILSKELSFQPAEKVADQDGHIKLTFKPLDLNNLNQNEVIRRNIKDSLRILEESIFKAKVPSDKELNQIFQMRTQSFIDIGMHTAIKDDLSSLVNRHNQIFTEYKTIANAQNVEKTAINESLLKDLNLEMQSIELKIKALSDEKTVGNYFGEAMFNMNPSLHAYYLKQEPDVEELSKMYYNGKNFNDLNSTESKFITSLRPADLTLRQRLRVAKVLFDKDTDLLKNHVGGVNEFIAKRSDIQLILNKLDFDYNQPKDAKGELEDFNTDILNAIPLFEKTGLDAFLWDAKYQYIKDEVGNMVQTVNPKYAILSDTFHLVLNTLIQKLNSSTLDSLTNEEYLLLEYVNKQLSNKKYDLKNYITPDFELYVYKKMLEDFFSAEDLKLLNTQDTNSLTEEELLKLKELKEAQADITSSLNNELEQSSFTMSEYKIQSGNDAYKEFLVYLEEYLTEKGLDKDTNFIRDRLLTEQLNELKQTEHHHSNLLNNFLKAIDVQFKSDPNNLFKLIKNETDRLLDKPLDDYILQNEITEAEITRSIQILNKLRATLTSYVDFSTDEVTGIGYFSLLNDYNQRNNLPDVHDTINALHAETLRKEMDHVQSKLLYLQKLNVQNQNSKIPNKQKLEAIALILQFATFIDSIKNLSIFELVKPMLANDSFKDLFAVDIYNQDALDKQISMLDSSKLKNIHKEIFTIESKIFKLINNLNEVDLALFHKSFKENFLGVEDVMMLQQQISEESFTTVTKQIRKINSLDNFFYLLNVFGADSSIFLLDLNDIYTTQPVDFALFGDQQMLLKSVHAFLQFHHADKFQIQPKFDVASILTEIQSTFSIDSILNILSIYGVLGTGKTTMIDFIGKILKKRGINLIATGQSIDNAENLLRVTGNKITNTKEQNLELLFRTIFGTDNYDKLTQANDLPLTDSDSPYLAESLYNSQILKIKEENEVIKTIKEFIDSHAAEDLSLGEKLNLLIFDESTQLHTSVMYLLDYFITSYNKSHATNKISVITTGDWRQYGAQVDSKTNVGYLSSNIQQIFNVRTLDLNSSIRTENNLKDANTRQLSVLLEIHRRNNDLRGVKVELTLKYKETNDLFAGDKAVDYSIQSYETLISKMIKLTNNDKSKLAIIGDPANENLKNLANNMGIRFYNTKEANGFEADYVLVDSDLTNYKKDISTYTKLLNVLLTRSKKGTYINKSIFEDKQIKMTQREENIVFDIKISKDRLDKYKLGRIKMINELLVELLSLEEMKEVPKEVEVVKPKSDSSTLKFKLGTSVVMSESDLSNPALVLELLSTFVPLEKDDELTEESTLRDKTYHSILYSEEIGTLTEDQLYDKVKIKSNLNYIKAIAKRLFIEYTYGDNKNLEELNTKFLKNLQTIFPQLIGLDVVVRKDNIIAVKMSWKNNNPAQYMVLGKVDGELLGQIKPLLETAEEIAIDKKYIVRMLLPLTNMRFRRHSAESAKINNVQEGEFVKLTLNELQKEFVVSPIYIFSKGTNDLMGDNKKLWGREFVLVSYDPKADPLNLYEIWLNELRQSIKNKNKADRDPLLGTSDSTVKLVLLDRQGKPVKAWLDSIMTGTNASTEGGLANRPYFDSYIMASFLKNILSKPKTTGLTAAEQTIFDTFKQALINAIRVTNKGVSEKTLSSVIYSDNFTSYEQIFDTLYKILLENNPKDVVDHGLVLSALLQRIFKGGTLVNKEDPTQNVIFQLMNSSDRDILFTVLEKILLKTPDPLTPGSGGLFRNGVYYTARFANKNLSGTDLLWPATLTLLEATADKYLVTSVALPWLFIPKADDLFESEVLVNEDQDKDDGDVDYEALQKKAIQELITVVESHLSPQQKTRIEQDLLSVGVTENLKFDLVLAFNQKLYISKNGTDLRININEDDTLVLSLTNLPKEWLLNLATNPVLLNLVASYNNSAEVFLGIRPGVNLNKLPNIIAALMNAPDDESLHDALVNIIEILESEELTAEFARYESNCSNPIK